MTKERKVLNQIELLKQKNTPMKPYVEWSRGIDVYRCPNCGQCIADVDDRKFKKRKHVYNHTNCCGQALDWS